MHALLVILVLAVLAGQVLLARYIHRELGSLGGRHDRLHTLAESIHERQTQRPAPGIRAR